MNDPRKHDLDDELRAVLGAAQDADFDYDALVAGTKARAGRIRRRRALAQGVTAAVLVPTLVGAGWIIGTNLGGSAQPGLDVAGTTQTQEPTDQAQQTAEVTENVLVTEGVPDTEEAPVDEERRTPPPVGDPTLPPYQQTPPPELPDQDWPGEPALSNRAEIPDARPTGIAFLDELGEPPYGEPYPRTIPLDTFTGAPEDTTEPGGVEPHSGMSWSFHDGTNEFRQPTVTITITAWDDSEAAMHALRTDEPTDVRYVWLDRVPRPDAPDELMEVRSVPDPLHWEGYGDSEDHLLVLRSDHILDMDLAGALVRQGDYLVGVTVQDFTEEGAVEAARQIAEQTAANLLYLDPVGGGE